VAHPMEPILPAENGSAEVSDQDREHAEQAKARGNDAFAGVPCRWRRPPTSCMHRAMCCQIGTQRFPWAGVAEPHASRWHCLCSAPPAASDCAGYRAGKHYPAAVVAYTEATQFNPSVAAYYSNRAFAHIRLENYGSAVADASKALELDSRFTKVSYFACLTLPALTGTCDGSHTSAGMTPL